jgi:hypothetical protein
MEEKKMMVISKEMYKVEDGKVIIQSEELANAIQNENVDLFVNEEINWFDNTGNCSIAC